MRGNIADRNLIDAMRSLRLTESEIRAVGKYIHEERPLVGDENYSECVDFLNNFFTSGLSQYYDEPDWYEADDYSLGDESFDLGE